MGYGSSRISLFVAKAVSQVKVTRSENAVIIDSELGIVRMTCASVQKAELAAAMLRLELSKGPQGVQREGIPIGFKRHNKHRLTKE